MSVTCDRLVVFSNNKTDLHDITEILLKVALNTIILTHWLTKYNNSGGVYLCVSYEICTHSRTGMVAGVNLVHTGIFISLLLLFITVLTLERDFDILYRYSNLADDHELHELI